jgi:SAM (Sterile alpha motif) domain-containing protein/adenylate/guanylate cyclase family protein
VLTVWLRAAEAAVSSFKTQTKFGEAIIDIASWLREIGLAEHAEIFRTEKIDAAVLPTLTDADLRELGLPLGDRKRLRAAIDALGTRPLAGPPSAPGAIQGAAAPRSAAEQRHLTVMFCDIADSTRLAATLELESLQQTVESYQQRVAACVALYDGFVAKFMGDGVLVYFGYPQAHEDDAERAIRAGLDIVAAMPSVRAIDGRELTYRHFQRRCRSRRNYLCRRRRRTCRARRSPEPRGAPAGHRPA